MKLLSVLKLVRVEVQTAGCRLGLIGLSLQQQEGLPEMIREGQAREKADTSSASRVILGVTKRVASLEKSEQWLRKTKFFMKAPLAEERYSLIWVFNELRASCPGTFINYCRLIDTIMLYPSLMNPDSELPFALKNVAQRTSFWLALLGPSSLAPGITNSGAIELKGSIILRKGTQFVMRSQPKLPIRMVKLVLLLMNYRCRHWTVLLEWGGRAQPPKTHIESQSRLLTEGYDPLFVIFVRIPLLEY